MGKILITLALVALLVGASGGKPASKPGQKLTPNPDAEADACVSAVEDKPDMEAGVSRGPMPLDVWLTWVAFVRAYGRPPVGADPVEAQRIQTILGCIRERLAAESETDEPPTITTTPIPGAWYRIKYGDTLFGLSAAAYPGGLSIEGKAPSNYLAARWINEAEENRRFWRMVPGEENLFPQGRITFLPRFGTFEQQRADSVKGGEIGAGGGYATIWIPLPPEG